MLFQLRQATIHDLDRVAPLFDAYRQFYGQTADLARARAYLAERFAHHESVILLASDEQGLGVGFIQLYPAFSSVRTVRTYVLNDLFVAPEARRQGVAEALMQAAVEHGRAMGVASLSLSTAHSNLAAQQLYESLGWKRDENFREYSFSLVS
ncbi:GNAT family N-acetyltransferase [Dyella tabacisoli]|uniref:GNAT family N-acetyltransferase n=1 Tax=Dyella tabacisoli TaxID=2282381 RepID=A0A369UUJ4_9GAMM|nr:GNAT family N-acetyltransferase [Dyella tabacisoli]RDD83705.1 GNAT family N-acetyltransferase [Dyella tabacisoli]